jgi:hypothetical protein
VTNTNKDREQTRDEVTGETTSAFPSAGFLNEPDGLLPPTARSPIEDLPPGSALLVVKRGPNALGARRTRRGGFRCPA